MSHINNVLAKLSAGRKKNFEEIHSAYLVVIGLLAFIAGGGLGFQLSSIASAMLEETVEASMSMPMAEAWCLVGVLSIPLWYFGCLATRCHTLLYERWFK